MENLAVKTVLQIVKPGLIVLRTDEVAERNIVWSAKERAEREGRSFETKRLDDGGLEIQIGGF